MSSKKKQLFRIVACLSPTEKAYFKKYAYKQKVEENASIFLLNLIEKTLKKEKAIDEEKLIKLFLKKYPKSNYTLVKSRLLQQLLNTLVEYDKKENLKQKIFDYINYGETLSKRKLYEDAQAVLLKAEKIAEDLEQIELLLMIKREIYLYGLYTQQYNAKNIDEKSFATQQKMITKLSNSIAIHQFIYDVVHFQKHIGVARSAEDFKHLKTMQDSPFFAVDYLPQLQKDRLDLAIAKSAVFLMLNDAHSALQLCIHTIENFKPKENLLQLSMPKYLSLYDILLQSALLSFNLSAYKKYFPLFEAIKPKQTIHKNLKQAMLLYNQAIFCIVANKPHLMQAISEAFNQIKTKSFIPNYRKVSLAYYAIFAPFLQENYATAYTEIQWLRNHQSLGIRYDIDVAIRTMECIILLENKDFDLLYYQLRSFYDFLKNRERKFKMETAMLSLLRSSLKVKNKQEQIQLFEETKATMQAIIKENPAEQAFINSFDIISWLESKTNSKAKPFATIFYEKHIQGKLV